MRDSLGTVPYELAPGLRCRRLEICGRLLPIVEARELDSFWMFVTRDPSWFVSEYEHLAKRSVVRDQLPTRASQATIPKSLC
jgi:hypothetical protein